MAVLAPPESRDGSRTPPLRSPTSPASPASSASLRSNTPLPLAPPPSPASLASSSSPPPSSTPPPSPTPHAPTGDTVDDAPIPQFSLQQIAQFYPRERVLASPVQWTALQLELLRCSFAPAAPLTAGQQPGGQPFRFNESRRGTAAARALVSSETYSARRRAIYSLLCNASSPLVVSRHGFRFRYCNRPSRFPTASMEFCLRKPSDNGCRIPIAAWNSCDRVRDVRLHAARLDSKKLRANPPVWRIAHLLFLAMLPPNPLRDPYTLATLISIAQAQRAARWLDGQPGNPVLLAHVVVTDEVDPDHVHVFSAYIPAPLLDMLENPTTPVPLFPPITIRTAALRCEPFETLESRLLEIIVPEWYERKPRKKEKKSKDGKPPAHGSGGEGDENDAKEALSST